MKRRPPRSTLFPNPTRFQSDTWGMAWCLEGFAEIASASGDLDRAAHLWGAAEALRASFGAPMPLSERADYDRLVAAARDRKSTRLHSSHANISYAVFCLKKK